MKNKSFSLVLMLLMMLFSLKAYAYEISEIYEKNDGDRGVIQYAVNDGEAVFMGYYSFEDSITEYDIPSYIDGYKVTVIGSFYDCQFRKITIPSTVKVIGDHAFGGYYSELKELVVPDTVTTFGDGAFAGSNIENIVIGKGIKEIPDYCFGDCYSLKSITLGQNIESIGDWAFTSCTSLESIIIPDSVTSFGESVFADCSSLETVVIGGGIKEIPENCFEYNSALKSVTLGNGVEIIGARAFTQCSLLESVKFGNNVKCIGEGAFEGCSSLQNISIPSKTETIGEFAFSDCSLLKHITIPDSVTSLGEFAFSFCTSLETVVVGNGVKELSQGVFEENPSLCKVELGNNVEIIGGQAFLACTLLEEINLPSKLNYIGGMAFWECSALKNVTFPDEVRTIDENAFYMCTSLSSLTLNDGLVTIGNDAFGETYSLNHVTIPSTVTEICEEAFYRSGVRSVQLENGVKRIGRAAFEKCSNLKSINIPDSVTYIGGSAFYGNSSLETIATGDGLEIIEGSAFSGCGALKSVSLGSNVRSIGSSVFSGCSSLEEVELNYGLETIGSLAFGSCTSLKEITIPESVVEISGWAFDYCTSLKEITLPRGVTRVSDYLFDGCTSLESVSMGYSVEYIGKCAFRNCDNLKELYIPNSVTSFGYEVIDDSGVKDVYFGGTKASWEKIQNYRTVEYNATVHFGKKAENVSTITTKKDNIYLCKTIVYKNLNDMTTVEDNYVICTDATVAFEGKEYKADENGIVPLPLSNGTITVSAPGCMTEVMNYTDYMNGIGIFLEKETDLPVIKSVKLGTREVRRSNEKFFKSKIDTFIAKVDYNGHDVKDVYIENGSNKWYIFSYGYSSEINIGEKYNEYRKCYIVVELADGQKFRKKLNMGYAPEPASKSQISFGSGFSNLGRDTIPYLDTIKFDFSIPNFPCEISVSGDKVVATIGVDVTKWNYNGEKGSWGDSRFNAHKALSEVLKDSYDQMEKKPDIVQEYNDLLKEVGSAKNKGLKSKFGFDATVSVLGYLEGTVTDEGVYFSDSGMIIQVASNVGFSDQGIVMVGTAPVPYNWEALIKGELQGKLQVMQRENRYDELTPGGEINMSFGFEVDGGPGLTDAHVNFGANGSINPSFSFNNNSQEFQCDAKIGMYMEAALGPFEHKFYLKSKTFPLYPKAESADTIDVKLFSSDGYSIIKRDYSDKEQGCFTANDNVMLLAESKVAETVIKTNTFKVSDPHMADLEDGKRIIVWVDDDTEVDSVNGRTIKYSYFNGDIWSEEMFVERNGMGAFNPYIKKVGNNVYLVWESVNAVLTEASSIDDMLKNTEIKYALFNIQTGAFENITSVTDNDYYDKNPVINDLYGTPVITWVSNSENNIFTANNNYSVNYAVLDGEAIAYTQIAAQNLSCVQSHAATGYSGYIEVIYISDTDGDITTKSDNQLFSTFYGQITDDNNTISALQTADNSVYFYNGGRLTNYYSGTLKDTGIILPSDKYLMCNYNKTVVYSDRNGVSNDIYAYYFDQYENRYGQPIKLTDMQEYYLEDVSGFANYEGELILAFNKRHIIGDYEENTGTLYGQSDLSTTVITPFCDIKLDYAYVAVNSIMPGYNTVIEADVTNVGSKTVNYVNVALYDGNGNLIASEDNNIKLLPGESGTVNLVYEIPEDFEGFDGSVVVSIADENQFNNNTYEVSLICRDVSVDNVRYAKKENDEYVLYADVTNASLKKESNIKVQLIKNDTVIQEKSIESIEKLETTVVVFDDLQQNGTYQVVVQHLENETMIGNNDEFITIASADIGFGYKIENVSIVPFGKQIDIKANVVSGKPITESTVMIVALYNKQGVLEATKIIPVNFNNETVKPISGSMDICNFESARIMLWTDSLSPVAAVAE